MIDYRRLQTDLIALAIFAASLFVALSLISFTPVDPPSGLVYPTPENVANWCGPIGAKVSFGLMNTFGYSCYVLLAAVLIFDLKLFSDTPFRDTVLRIIGVGLILFSVATSLTLLFPGLGQTGLYGSGGRLGATGANLLQEKFSLVGTGLVLVTLTMAGLMLAAEVFALALLRKCVWVPFVALHSKIRPLKPTEEELQQQEEDLLDAPICGADDECEEEEAEDEIVPVSQKKTALKSRGAKKKAKAAAAEKPVEEPPVADPEPEAELAEPEVEAAEEPDAAEQDVADEADDDWEMEDEDYPPLDPPKKRPKPKEPSAFRVNPPVVGQPQKKIVAPPVGRTDQVSADVPFELPDWEILEDAEDFPYEELAKKAQVAAATLERTFQEFNLNIKVKEIDTGPVVTQFELELEPGLRVNKVMALADDLAIALRVPAVRIVSSIPGKNTMGVEVPNETRVMVRLRELMESSQQQADKMRLPLFLGKDVSGHPMTVDLAKMPHLLIAGRTGTGKSVCLNTLILSLLMTRSPEQVKMLMIDPKMVELSPYTRIPHLMHPVITDMKKAEAILQWAVDKMEERYDMLARTGVRHLDSYNKLGKPEVLKRLGLDPNSQEAAEIPEQMPYIVIVADEMADMIMTSGKDVEGHIIRLAQKSRAVGIHLVLATQKPTVDVLTGLIKSNLPARISFQVASRTDSRVVLDEMGAERLLGNGDMLYLAPGTSNLSRAQGTYVSDQEVNDVIDYLGQHEPQYSQELSRVTNGSAGGTKRGMDAIKERDELYEQAIEVVVREGRGSVSLLQRALGVGYGRGARLIDYMAEDGIVGDYNGSQAREVLYTPEEWAAMRDGAEMEDEVGV